VVTIRVEVRAMDDAGLGAFRQALTASMALSDDRGYSYWAGIHGLPLPISCRHGDLYFLPWHRAYLYYFEKSLQDRVPGVALPWWDWTSIDSHLQGMPPSYSQNGDNPLRSGRVVIERQYLQLLRQTPGLVGSGAQPSTLRDPGEPDDLPRSATIDSIVNDAHTFADFSTRLENVHDAVHVWVGGSMSQVPIAAFDPVFWAHHAMIDRIWYLWQTRHPNAAAPSNMRNTALAPFPMTVAQTLDISQLDYDYAIAAVR
jgi:tyrosinase